MEYRLGYSSFRHNFKIKLILSNFLYINIKSFQSISEINIEKKTH